MADANDDTTTSTLPAEPTTTAEAQALFEELASEAIDEATGAPTAAPKPQDDDAGNGDPPAAPAPTPAPPAVAQAPAAPSLSAEDIAALRQLPAVVKAMGGRVAGIQSTLDKARTSVEQSGGEAPTKAEVADAAKSTEKWNKLKIDFPDWAAAIEEKFGEAKAAPDMSAFEGRLTAAEQRTLQLEGELRLADEFPGWKRTVKTPEFVEWYKALPPEEKTKVYSAKSPDEIAESMRMFDARNKTVDTPAVAHPQSTSSAPAPAAAPRTAPDNKAILSAAVAPRGTRRVPQKSLDEMSDRELFDHYANQEATS